MTTPPEGLDWTVPDQIEVAFLVPAELPTAQDIVGPWEVCARWPGVTLRAVCSRPGRVLTDTGLVVETLPLSDSVAPQVIVVPGCSRPFQAMRDLAAVTWLRTAAPSATWVTSVCTGAGVLAVAGLLGGRKASTHWAFRSELADLGVQVVPDRVVVDGNVVTAGGITAGIDMALQLTVLHYGVALAEGVQLTLNYDPKPPTDMGSPERPGIERLVWVTEMYAAMVADARPADWRGRAEVWE